MLDGQFILLAEDDPNDVLLIQRAFQKAGLGSVLKIVPDGAEAIDYLSGRGAYAASSVSPHSASAAPWYGRSAESAGMWWLATDATLRGRSRELNLTVSFGSFRAAA